MSNPDNNLLNFLKTNSLFSNSPTKNGPRKSKSRSKDKNTESRNTPTKNRQTNFDDGYNKPKPFGQPFGQPLETNFNGLLEPSKTFAPLQPNTFKPSNIQNEGRFNTFEDFQVKKPLETRGINQSKQHPQLWTGLVSYSASFQSARIESSHCLQTLDSKVKTQIANVNYKIENFQTKMYRVITDEFKSLRERIMFIIDESFKECQKYIREYMKTQEDKLAGDLVKMRETLQKQHVKIEAMKDEIGKPNWRKVAGEIIASQLEHRVDELVKKSNQLVVGRWELGDLVGYRLKDLQKDLREVVRLKRQT